MEYKGGDLMVWFYIAGFISGVIGTLMFGRYIAKRGLKKNENNT